MRDVTYQFGEFHLDAGRFQLRCKDEELRLEKKPMELLLLLAASRGQLVTRAEIATHLWGKEVFVDTEHGINTAIRKVRAALGETPEAPRFLQTVPGMGYRFVAPTVIPATDVPLSASGTAAVPEPAVLEATPPPAVEREPAASLAETDITPTPAGAAAGLWLRWWTLAGAAVLAGAVVLFALEGSLHAGRVARHALGDRGSGAPVVAAGAAPRVDIPDEAREQYQRGVFLLDRRNVLGSTVAFRRAVELAPNYAPAYAGLSQALEGQAKLGEGVPGALIPEAESAARRAIALNPGYDGGYVALGTIQTSFTWEWKDAEANLRRGLELNPQNATGRIWYATVLQATGRQDEAIEQARLAVEAAPLSFFMVRMQGSVLYFARRYEEAMRSLSRAQEMTPQHPNVVDNWIAWVDEQLGLYDDAVAHDELALQQVIAPAEIAALRSAYAENGWRGYWQKRLEQMPPETQHGCGLYRSGVAALRTGKRDLALATLHKAAEQHCFWMGMIRVDPTLDPLRGDPGFAQIERVVFADDSRSR